MKKITFRLFCIAMSLMLFFTSISPSFIALAENDLVFTDVITGDSNYYPFLDATGKYHRYSNNELVEFNTDYEEMVSYFQQKMLSRETSVDYNFATTDLSFGYVYENAAQLERAQGVAKALFDKLFRDIFVMNSVGEENAGLGDYLYNSISSYAYSYNVYMSKMDTPQAGATRYFTFSFSITNIKYYTTLEQENAVKQFAKTFSENFLTSSDATTGMSDYDKVKTIYDFIVRNATYDYDVFEGKIKNTNDRYTIAHSAYGAIFGSKVKYENGVKVSSVNDDINAYILDIKQSVTGQKIVNTYNQGRSVCEGYSKLFYYLCMFNGIKCRIVDGDYSPNYHSSDPHEWNYVFLNDYTDEGERWFQIDTTFASQKSHKEIDYNNYDYFLCGSANYHFVNHQQAYDYSSVIKPQLYDWYNDENVSSVSDYTIPAMHFSDETTGKENVIFSRETYYDDSDTPRYTFILCNSNGNAEIAMDEDERGNFITYRDVDGFSYNGKDSRFTAIVPYIINRAYSSNTVTATETGEYAIQITGANDSVYTTKFTIVPLDMSDMSKYIVKVNNENIGYVGDVITLDISIIDGNNNELKMGSSANRLNDYTYEVLDSNGKSSTLKNMGTYTIKLHFHGNYTDDGNCTFKYVIGKINLNNIEYEDYIHLTYLPDSYKSSHNINNPSDYFLYGVNQSPLRIGDIAINPNKDYTVSHGANDSLNYNSEGTITLTGVSSSANVVGGTKTRLKYIIDEKYDISYFDGKIADNSADYVYTGSAITPTDLRVVNNQLVKGKDYEIVSYSNNVNASQSAYVTIRGINGCTGTAKMKFQIVPASLLDATVTYSSSTGSCVVKLGSKTLVKGVDYTETKYNSSNGYTFAISGIGNYKDAKMVNVAVDHGTKPTSSGNKVSLSATKYTYDGKAKKPTVTVKNSNGKAISTYYYTVKYSSNTNVGKGKATVTFRNGYSGTSTASFVINPKGTSIKSLTAGSKCFTAKWTKQATQTTGYQIQYSTSSKMSSPKTVTVTSNSTVSKKITKLTGKKKYYVRIRTYKTVSGVKYYSSWSAVKYVTTKK